MITDSLRPKGCPKDGYYTLGNHVIEIDDQGLAKIKGTNTIAGSTLKMNKGLKSLSDGFEDWSSILKKSSKESEEYEEALDGMRNALSDVLDVYNDFVSDNFIVE
jgi:N-acetylglucosamine-6-phosphate deacetylase